jgi:GNAT superfamily N-acetyltransferase
MNPELACDCGEVRIRLVEPTDLAGIEHLLSGLSMDARYRRWFSAAVDLHAAACWALAPPDGLGLVAVAGDEIVGHGALVPSGPAHAEVAFEVAKPWRHHGIATHLLQGLEAQARELGIDTLEADVLSFNADMLRVFAAHGDCTRTSDGSVVHVTFPARALAVQASSSSSPRSSA